MFAMASARTQRFLLRLVGRLLLKQGNTHTPSSSWLFSHEQKNEFSVARPFGVRDQEQRGLEHSQHGEKLP